MHAHGFASRKLAWRALLELGPCSESASDAELLPEPRLLAELLEPSVDTSSEVPSDVLSSDDDQSDSLGLSPSLSSGSEATAPLQQPSEGSQAQSRACGNLSTNTEQVDWPCPGLVSLHIDKLIAGRQHEALDEQF